MAPLSAMFALASAHQETRHCSKCTDRFERKHRVIKSKNNVIFSIESILVELYTISYICKNVRTFFLLFLCLFKNLKIQFMCDIILIYMYKGVGEGGGGGGGAGGNVPPHFQKWGGAQVGLCPPTFGQSKCSNFTICSYFVVKNTIFFKIFFARQLK